MELGRYRLRNGLGAQIISHSTADCLDAETGKAKRVKLAWGRDSRNNHVAWDDATGEHHAGGHVPPGSVEYDIVAPAENIDPIVVRILLRGGTAKEVAEHLGCDKSYIHRVIRTQDIPYNRKPGQRTDLRS